MTLPRRFRPAPKARAGRAPIGGMNRTEQSYAQYLDWQVRVGSVSEYYFEEFKIRLANRTWYTPDFLVVLADGTVQWHEVKGFMEDDAAVKLKVTSRLFWRFPVILVKAGPRGAWSFTEVSDGL